MPPKISSDITFDEVFFTRATIKADPDAADLLPHTDDWLSIVDAARHKDRESRIAGADATAARIISNDRLDRACTAFGDELYLAVRKDTSSSRWLQFFTVSVSAFIRQALAKQVAKVRAWLDAKVTDPVLDHHRASLDTWSKAADSAIVQTNGLALVRGGAQIVREQMADDLTRERDGLHTLLAQRARERGFPRDWPNLFFKTESRKRAAEPDEPAAPPDGHGTPGGNG